jgi:hypothetical protein
MTATRILSAAVSVSALMLMGACGGAVAGSQPTRALSPSRALSASVGAACTTGARSVCVTPGGNGHRITVGVGWTVGLNLHSPNSSWSAPSEYGAHLLRQIGGVRRDGGAVVVAYRAIARGETDVRAFERPVCTAGHMCPQYILVWQVHILVTASSGSSHAS